jgi:tRNA(His) guanylyltransferase
MNDPLGDRMKNQYEDRTRYMLPRRTYTIIRLDGVAFHTLTQGLIRPFDGAFTTAMWEAAYTLAGKAQGFKLGYVQSDEISILLTDFAEPATAAWFDGNIQKIASVSASIAAFRFNDCMNTRMVRRGYFDARVFVIPDPVEVENYFIWRQKDAIRNSINSFAQSIFSAKELHGKSIPEVHEMLHKAGRNWATEVIASHKNGTVIWVQREGWGIQVDPAPEFLKNRNWLREQIPIQWAEKKELDKGT